MTIKNYREHIENQSCSEYIKELYRNWHENHNVGDPNINFVRKSVSKKGRQSLVFDIDYDYFPTDINQIDRFIESVQEEWVFLCQDHPKYGDIEITWKGSFFPQLILRLVLFIEGRSGICILDDGWNKYHTKTLLSGNIEEIDLLREYDPLGIYGEVSRLVYICWMPIFSRERFNMEIVREFEILLYRIALQASDRIGKNGRTRDDEVNRTRGIASSRKLREEGIKTRDIQDKWKEYQQKGYKQKDIASMVANAVGVTPHYARKRAKEAGLFKK